jgi:hypothetical protein
MRPMLRFTALIPMVAFVAACSGAMPTGPGPITSNESYQAAGDVTAMLAEPQCANLGRIALAPVTSPASPIHWIEATYYFNGPAQPCPAPRWTSDRSNMVVDKTNPMRAGFPRMAGGQASLTATARNGVSKSIVVDLGPTRMSDGDQACKQIVAVDMRVLPVGISKNEVSLEARYRYDGPVLESCSIAPTWTASRRGLRVNPNNLFRASITRTAEVRTTVTATAPNGVFGRITF